MYGPPPVCKRKRDGQGGLRKCMRPLLEESLPAMMECAALSSHLVGQSWRLLPVTGFESAGFDRCAISWFASRLGRKSLVSVGFARRLPHRPTREADMFHS